MGQLQSRPPAPIDTRNGRRQSQLKRIHPKRQELFEPFNDSCVGSRHEGPAKTRTPRPHPAHPSKDTAIKKAKKHDPSSPPKRPSRPKAHDSVISTRHRNDHHASALRSRTKPPSQQRQQQKTHHDSVATKRSPSNQSLQRREKRECVICTDTRSLHRFPNRPPTVQCQHAVDVCRRCLRTWIESEFATKIWDEINCPVCSIRMQHEDLREFAPSTVFRRYDKLSTRTALEAIPGFTWCTAKGCKSGQIHTAASNKFTCVACKKSHCTVHHIAWHKRETCREYDYRTNKKIKKDEEAASKKLILDTTKKCPGCKRSIEKSYGCDHMTCSRCRHEFCWQCLAPYVKKERGRVRHIEGCGWFDPNRTFV